MRGLRIRSDPRLSPVEKETCFNILGGGNRVSVQTVHPTAIRGLLAQPEFKVEHVTTSVVKGEKCITGIAGSLPVACLKIGFPRRDNRLSRVFARRAGRRQALDLCPGDAAPPPRSEARA